VPDSVVAGLEALVERAVRPAIAERRGDLERVIRVYV
jgi:hypothetical protein